MQLEESVTLFDDNKVENRFAELQITADGITSEVSRKVGNDEVISRINQSAEGIQIQANKVNIEGATIFSSGRLSQSSLNSAYDAKGAATSSVSNLKSDLSSSSGTTVINGGHIVTGTLSAGAINANSGTFSVLNVPDLNASKITAGTLDANRIGAASIAIGKLDSNAQATISNAAKTATNFITDIDSSGIWVTPSGLKPSDTSTGAGATGTRINGSGMQIYKGGVEVASYSDTTIELGKNSISSVISLCGGKGTIERHNTLGLLISTTESDKSVTLRTPSYSRVSVNPDSIELFVDTYTYLEVNTTNDRIYMGTHTQPGEGSTSTSTGFYLGLSAYRWRQLYCWSAPNTGSDGKRKDVLGDIDFAKDLIMGLKPVEFQWKDSDHIRSHMGFIAQDAAKVGKALGKDLSFYEANYIDESKGDYHGEEVSDEELSWGMMYDELIAPLVKVVQMQQKELDQLKIEFERIKDKGVAE